MRFSFGSIAPVIGFLGLVALAPACEEELPSTNFQDFTDQAGRSCSTDVYAHRSEAECDVDPATLVMCEAGTEAVFTYGATLMGALENCAGCYKKATESTFVDSMTCAFVTCETDADCVEDRYTCQSNTCQD